MHTDDRPPSAPGVYLFLAEQDNRIMYAGMAHDLEKVLYRYRGLEGRQKMRDRAAARKLHRVAWVVCSSGATPPSLEQLLIRRYQPPWNTQHNPNARSEATSVPLTADEQRWIKSTAVALDQHLALALNQPAPAAARSVPRRSASRKTAAVLAIALGTVGVHKFYLGQNRAGWLRVLFSWTFIPTALGIIDGVRLLAMSDTNFAKTYE